MPDATPFGDTFFDAKVLAIVSASFVKSPSGGYVASDSAVTFADQRLVVLWLPVFFFFDILK